MRVSGIVIIAALLFASCDNRHPAGEANSQGALQTTPGAKRFKLEAHDGFVTLKIINPWQDTEGNVFTYYLFPRGAILPDSLAGSAVIRVPVKRIICMSTTHLAMLKALGVEEAIVGISGSGLVFDPEIRSVVKAGKIPDVGYENNLDKELVVSLEPDLLMAYGVSAASAEYLRKLAEMGVMVMYNADYLEEHPLARCEWIKVFGLLTGREPEADSIYQNVCRDYLGLADSLRLLAADHQPRVLLGAPWEDVWYVSPSNSFAARLLADAGGSYIFSDLAAPNSVPFSTEAVFQRATEAEIWLNPGSAATLDDIRRADYRLAQLPVFKTGRIYNNIGRVTADGGNDYWESAVIHPDILLRDIASVLHPGFMPEYSPVYYRRLE